MIRKVMGVSFVFVLLTLVFVVVVSASTEADKPYQEGEGADGVGKTVDSSPNKPYVEGMTGVSGRQVDRDSSSRGDIAEGEAGTTGRHLGTGLPADAKVQEGLDIIYRFSGVTDDGEQGSASRREATSIHCTNVSTSTTQVEVQIFQWNGTDVYTGTVNMPVNRTFTFSTQNTTIYFDDILLGGSPGTDAIFQGSGIIFADNPNVICTAQALDPLNYPPIFATSLPLYKMIFDVDLSGPTNVLVHEDYSFTATVLPSRATTPIVYTWQATGLPTVKQTGDTADTVVFNWDTLGSKTVTVTASNAGSSVSRSISFEVAPHNNFMPYLGK